MQNHRFPDDIEVDLPIIVNYAIAHADDLGEGNPAKASGRLRSQAGGGLTYYKQAPQHCVLVFESRRKAPRSNPRTYS